MKKLSLSIFTLIVTFITYSQQGKVASLENLTSEIPSSITPEGDTLFRIKFRVNLTDTLNVQKIHVKVGTTFKGNDIFEGDYYVYGTQPNSTAFTRDKLQLVGDAGEHPSIGVYFYEITVEDFQGVKQIPYIRQQ